MGAPGLVSPDGYPTRDPRDKSMTTGRIINPPRFEEVGGLAGPGAWTKEGGCHAFAQMSQGNVARVEKPTSVKSAHRSSKDND